MRVSRFEEGLKAGCQPPAKVHYSEWVVGEAIGTTRSQWRRMPNESIRWMSPGRRVGPNSIVGVGVAGHLGTGRIEKKLVSSRAYLAVVCDDEKKIVCAAVMRQMSCMRADMTVWIRE